MRMGGECGKGGRVIKNDSGGEEWKIKAKVLRTKG